MKQDILRKGLLLILIVFSYSLSHGQQQDCTNCFDDGPNGCGKLGYYDADNDGYGTGNLMCFFGANPSNFASKNGDCNDNDASLFPRNYYIDSDGDGVGGGRATVAICSGYEIPVGYTLVNGDCDDTDENITLEKLWYEDSDDDGYGDSSTGVFGCVPPDSITNPVDIGGDYDDDNSAITNVIPITFYLDNDLDGYGISTTTVYASQPPAANYSQESGDCDDTNPLIHPNTNWYLDTDGDGLGGKFPVQQCTPPTNGAYVLENGDLCPNDVGPTANSGCPPDDFTVEPYNTVLTLSYNIFGETIGKNKSYYNDLGKFIQTQTIDFKTGKVWANETLYDGFGRPAFQTLSAPINKEGHLFYRNDFTRNASGLKYTLEDFETDSENPSTISNQENTLGWYYSANNTEEAYQDITQYPFSRTIYSKLNPGGTLKTIGGNKIAGTWKSAYTFSMVAGQELSKASAFNSTVYNNIKTIKTVSRDIHGVENVSFTDIDGKSLAAARSGGTIQHTSTIIIGKQGFVDVHVPTGIIGFTINESSEITTEVYNLITEELVTTPSNTLPNGFYRVAITNLEDYNLSSPVSVTYKDNYYDYALNEYDKVGRLIASKQPLEHLKSTFTYNTLGQLVSTTSPDEGTANFKYRKDGQIRFSQNSKQAAVNEFSYTNYDSLGRPVESGVAEGTFSDLNPNQETFVATNKKEQHYTAYDYLENGDLPGDISWDDDLVNMFENAEEYGMTNESDYSSPQFLAGNVAATCNRNEDGRISTQTFYSYDIYGRVTWIVQSINGLDPKTIDYEYDPITSQVVKVIYQKGTPSELFVHKYSYNTAQELVKVETSTDNTNFTTHADYEYYETGALKRVELAEGIQGIDYVYNLAGQLKAINHPDLVDTKDPGGDSTDLFGMTLDYYTGDYTRTNDFSLLSSGTDQFNGNIKGMTWKTQFGNVTNPFQYTYEYNRNNWLTDATFNANGNTQTGPPEDLILESPLTSSLNAEATNSILLNPGFEAFASSTLSFSGTIIEGAPGGVFGGEDYKVSHITYDVNGNIQTLNRNKNTEEIDGELSNKMDVLDYKYYEDKPNQLRKVEDAVITETHADDIKTQTTENNYIYNSIGQLIENIDEGVKYEYNASGLVTKVYYNNNLKVQFFYNDKGFRVQKKTYAANGTTVEKTTHYVRDASGSALAIYEDGVQKELPIYGASRLGVYNKPSSTSVYQLTDHLGNVRAVIAKDASGNAAALTHATDYYPFGMPMPNRQLINGEPYRYAYQGQEKDPETGKEAFQLRLWDSRIGRWLTTDPANQYPSPYLGMGNNPMNGTDPDGAKFFDWVKDLVSGDLTWVDSTGEQALIEAATKFGHRSVLDADNKGLDKVEVISTDFFTDGSDLSIENQRYYNQIFSEQVNYIEDVSSRLNVSFSSVIFALNNQVPTIETSSSGGFYENIPRGEGENYLAKKFLPKTLYKVFSTLSHPMLESTSLGNGYKGNDLTPRVKTQLTNDLKLRAETIDLINNRNLLNAIRIHRY